MRTRHDLELAAREFLQEAGLQNQAYSIAELIEGIERAGIDVVCRSFPARGNLRGGIFTVGSTTVLFYPDPSQSGFFTALQTIAHEIGHIVLGHRQHRFSAGENPEKDAAAESEAEAFARIIIEWRAAAEKEEDRAFRSYFSRI